MGNSSSSDTRLVARLFKRRPSSDDHDPLQTMISNDLADNDTQTPLASARKEILGPRSRGNGIALARIDGNVPPASPRNVADVTRFLAVEIIP
jgi:hypothetical protein